MLTQEEQSVFDAFALLLDKAFDKIFFEFNSLYQEINQTSNKKRKYEKI